VRILLDLKSFVFIHICKCGFYDGYARHKKLTVSSSKLRAENYEKKVACVLFRRVVFYVVRIARTMGRNSFERV
jgi:hypothetical protein